jgi:hypothetical protein
MLRTKTYRLPTRALLGLALLLACGAVGAQTFSHILSFQGRLCATDGKPLPDGPYAVQFTIYDAETDGSPLWQETQGVTQVGGLFMAYLGSVAGFAADLFLGGDRWLGIKVGNDPEMPTRFRLTPSPWAIRSAEADHAKNADQATNADKVDGIHAGTSPTPNYLLPLDGSGKFPASVIPPDADWRLIGNAGTNPATSFLGTTDSQPLVIRTNGAEVMRVTTGGNVGIATASPAQRLDVAGMARMTGFQLTTSPVANYVLRSDAAGVGTWQPDGLALPFAGSANSNDPALKITNNGSGEAVRGDSTNGYGVYGWSVNNSGLYGSSSASAGVFGYANSRAGVEGLNGNWGNLGRLATDSYGAYGEAAISAAYGVYGKHNPSGDFGYLGGASYGVEGQGNTAGGYFKDRNGTGSAYVGYENTGISAVGDDMGGCFSHTGSTAFAYVGYGGRGIDARGNEMGGYFKDQNASGYAYVGYGERGIEGYGNDAGGYFKATSGTGYALVGYKNEGISAHGTTQGGYFADDDSTGAAHVAYGNRGIEAAGSEMGGYFGDSDNSGRACVGYGNEGIYAVGWPAGDFLCTDGYNWAYLATADEGINAYGTISGGWFHDTTSGADVDVARDIYKILGNGTVSFVQNHPTEPDKVIVYACPEGDEVATYTRGTAKLADGKAIVPLGETFKWVTNPDIGLTAHLTCRGKGSVLFVESLTTSEMVVRSLEGFPDDVTFDYIVYGLRIGFEEASIVQGKEREAYIPSMEYHRALYEQKPDLRQYNALERFKRMQTGAHDLSGAKALHDAVGEFDPTIHRVERDALDIR